MIKQVIIIRKDLNRGAEINAHINREFAKENSKRDMIIAELEVK